jgi:dTDP-4-dehydrorhamnose 3,5-epimerase
MLYAAEPRQFWLPAGFAHGFQALEDNSTVFYKCTSHYLADAQHSLLWNDPALGIDWPLPDPILSPRDVTGVPLAVIAPVTV